MKIKISELHKILIDIISKDYYSRDEAKKIADVYIFAEITGKNTQGVLKLLGTEPAQSIKPKYAPKAIKETTTSVLIDGGGAAGPLVAQTAVETLVDKAKEHGFAIAGTNNAFSSIGALGYYAHKIASSDLISIIGAGSERAVAYTGGIEPVFGTNPIAFGFPTKEQPIVFDMATSALAFYDLIRAEMLRHPIPKNTAIDKDGNITTNPKKAMDGAILPFDKSYKGSGLGLMIELLAGPLTGASYVFDKGDWGAFFLTFSPDLLSDTNTFKTNASNLVAKVKSAKTQPGHTIHIPGYDSLNKYKQLLEDDGPIEIDNLIAKKLKKLV